jgi:hypothetical protein
MNSQPTATPSKLLIELHYLPCVQFFSELKKHDILQIEACETYQKQSFRNRTRILTAQKVDNLNIPVLAGNSHLPIKEVRIDYSQKWQLVHQRAIQAAYGKSPFFEFYSEDILRIFDKKPLFLFDLNLEFLTVCLKLLGLKKQIEFTSEYQAINNNQQRLLADKRGVIHPKNEANIPFKPYQQVFGKQFEANLSIIDTLFCEGNNSTSYLN